MPAFKYRQKNSLIVFERGHKAHGYVQTADVFLFGNRPLRPGRYNRENLAFSEDFRYGKHQDPLIAHVRNNHFLVFRIQYHTKGFFELCTIICGNLPLSWEITIIIVGPDTQKGSIGLHAVDNAWHSPDNQLTLRIELHLVNPNDPRLRPADDAARFHVPAIGSIEHENRAFLQAFSVLYRDGFVRSEIAI